jgi:hypothetical protein
MIPEDAIRLRSYQIWQRQGCPDGKAVEHWLRAKSELEAEYRASPLRFDFERNVIPLPTIRRPPQRATAARIPAREWRAPSAIAEPIAARQ